MKHLCFMALGYKRTKTLGSAIAEGTVRRMAEIVDIEYRKDCKINKVTVLDGDKYTDLLNVTRCKDCRFFKRGDSAFGLGTCMLVNGTSYKMPWGYCDNGVDKYNDKDK